MPKGTNMLIAGITGGVFAAACSHPFDTIKTRMQVGCEHMLCLCP
jgi:hypothetical protein